MPPLCPSNSKRWTVRGGIFLVVSCLIIRFSNTGAPQSQSSSSNLPKTFPTSSGGDPLNVTLTFSNSRSDRMGSRIQLPLSVWILAKHHGWNFCCPPGEPMARMLSFPECSDRQLHNDDNATGGRRAFVNDTITESGTYFYPDAGAWPTIRAREADRNLPSMLSPETVEEWRNMILGAKVRPELDGELWIHPNRSSTRIAVHARRGDILPGVRNDVWIGDDQIISLIEMAKHYVRQRKGRDHVIEVHMFSEDYGAVNWTRYGNGLVDRFHLAPRGSWDIELNIRDWKHFVTADVMIIGGSFSQIPGLARYKPSEEDGLPMTLYTSKNNYVYVRDWVLWVWKQEALAMAARFPNGTITAKFVGSETTGGDGNVNVTVAMMLDGLCPDCQNAAVPHAYTCRQRIQGYPIQGGDYSAFSGVQKTVSNNHNCAPCNPDSCRVRVEKPAPDLPIESIIGNRYVQTCPLFIPVCLEGEYDYLS